MRRKIRPTMPACLRNAGKVAGRLEDLGASFLHPLTFVDFALADFFMQSPGLRVQRDGAFP